MSLLNNLRITILKPNYDSFAFVREFKKALLTIFLIVSIAPLMSFSKAEADRFALIIEQTEYKDLADLGGASDEANAINNALKKAGFEIYRAQNLDKAGLSEEINKFRRIVAKHPGALAFVYYTGHGARDPNDEASENYLLGTNSNLIDRSDLPVYGVKVSEIIDSFQLVSTRATIIVIDACRVSASFGKAASKGLAPISSGKNMLLAYSTGLGDIAEVGIFAPILALELSKSNQDISTSFLNAKYEVSKSTNKKQLPWIDDKIGEPICLYQCDKANVIVPNSSEDLKNQELVWSMINDCKGYSLYLKHWPSGIYANTALRKTADASCVNKPVIPIKENDFKKKSLEATYEDALKAMSMAKFDDAFKQFELACYGGFLKACSPLGELYADAVLGPGRDYDKARDLFKMSCTDKVFDGCVGLGELYRKGHAVKFSGETSFNLFKKACDNKIYAGCNRVAQLYAEGTGVKANDVMSHKYEAFACDAGYSGSCLNVGFDYLDGRGVKKDIAKGDEIVSEFCNNGMEFACSVLADTYTEIGKKTKDFSKAIFFHEKACQINGQKNSVSCILLRKTEELSRQ